MHDKEFLRRVKGWVLTARTWNGQHLSPSRRAHERGRMTREFIAASHIDVDTQTMICGLPIRTLDKFLLEFKPRNVHNPEQMQERVETYICKLTAGHTSDDLVGWYDDKTAEPFPTDQWDVQRMLGKRWQYASKGSQDDGGQRQREHTDNDWQWTRDSYERTQTGYSPQGHEECDYDYGQGWYDHTGSHAPTDKGTAPLRPNG